MSAIVGACLLVTLSAVELSLADTTGQRDANDVEGPLDIAWVEAGHGHRSGRVRHEIKTYERWRSRVLLDGVLVVSISNDEDRFIERELQIYYEPDRQRLVGRVYRIKGRQRGEKLGEARVKRPSLRRVEAIFDQDLLGKRIDRYRWRVQSHYESRGLTCSGESGGCSDYAPGGRISHQLD